MRLRLHIHRHSLPPIRIVHTTGTGPAPHTGNRDSTIANLLQDVNDIVPLESESGEWGLEDYVVEVIDPSDPGNTYECLHYQTCAALLKEDDQLIIRALSTEDLRARRLGGRHQISADGRHLIDGIAFGKQWLRKASRPGLIIPPRKRRMLEFHGAELDEIPEQLYIQPSDEDPSQALLGIDEEDDEEEDEDFAQEDDLTSGDREVILREDFDDADSSSEVDEEGEETDNDSLADLAGEVQLLLQDAADIDRSDGPHSARPVTRSLKRKRPISDEGQSHETESFSGFSSPAKSPGRRLPHQLHHKDDNNGFEPEAYDRKSVEGFTLAPEGTPIIHVSSQIVNEVADGSDTSSETSSSSTSSSDPDEDQSDTDSDNDSMLENIALQQARRRALNLVKLSQETSSSSDSSSYQDQSGSDSESESDADSMMDSIARQQESRRALNLIKLSEEKSSESDSSFSEDHSSSSSSSEGVERSEHEDDTSSSGSDADSESSEEDQDSGKFANHPVSQTSVVSAPAKPPVKLGTGSAPGQGSNRTRQNNNRVKKRKRLASLKVQGLLPVNADFRLLDEYDQRQNVQDGCRSKSAEQPMEEVHKDHIQESSDFVVQKQPPIHDSADENGGLTTAGDIQQTFVQSIEELPKDPSAASTPKRARLDLESSRRMVFSSLGLRAPKTKEAEQALRDKLSRSASSQHVNGVSPSTTQSQTVKATETPEDQESWKAKLVISAIECERDDLTLTAPPFPFQQGWWKNNATSKSKSKRRDRDHGQYYQQENGAEHFAPDVSALDYGDEAMPSLTKQSETLQKNDINDGIPIPTTFDDLSDLHSSQLQVGMIIAFKQLQLDETTNYQPEVSAYMVGRITKVNVDEIELTLAKKFWRDASTVKYDQETGQRILGKFEVELDEGKDESDDGWRQITFSNMIAPKVVEAFPVVEVPDSGHGTENQEATALINYGIAPLDHVPESAELEATNGITHLEVATPRREEITSIIKEAGFDSALDEGLLEAIKNPAEDSEGLFDQVRSSQDAPDESKQGVQTRSPQSPILSKSSPPVDYNAPLDPVPQIDSSFPSQEDTSSPVMSTQETVAYPHISQIQLESFETVNGNNSSSHQDAQRLSPAPAADLSFPISELGAQGDSPKSNGLQPSQEYQGLSSPQGDGSQSLVQDEASDKNDNGSPVDMSSFLGRRGGYVQAYSKSDDDEDDASDDSLPSMRDLTSSQKSTMLAKRYIRSDAPKVTNIISQSTTKRRLRSSQFKSELAPENGSDPPELSSSQPEIKMSQNPAQVRLSQIPTEMPVIDLTYSSEAASPVKRDEKKVGGRSKKESQINGKRNITSNQSHTSVGIGTRRFLTQRRSQI